MVLVLLYLDIIGAFLLFYKRNDQTIIISQSGFITKHCVKYFILMIRGKISYIVQQYLVGTCSGKSFSSLFCHLDWGKFSARNNHTVVKSLRLWCHLTKVARFCKGLGREAQEETRHNLGAQGVNKLLERIDSHTHTQKHKIVVLLFSCVFKYHLYADSSQICVSSQNLTSELQTYISNCLLDNHLNVSCISVTLFLKHKSQLCSLLFSVIFILIDGTTVYSVCSSENHMIKFILPSLTPTSIGISFIFRSFQILSTFFHCYSNLVYY